MEEHKDVPRCILAITLTPILLIIFVWLEETAKGSEIHYISALILNDFFVQLMFGAFIPLAIGTCLLIFSRIESAPKKLKYILYAVTILSLIATLFVANSLATVPRGGRQHSYGVSSDTFDTFSLNLTLHQRLGVYYGESYQTIFTNDYPTSLVYVSGYGESFMQDPEVRLRATNPINLSGTLYLFIYLYRATDDYSQRLPLYFSFSEESIDFDGSSVWVRKEIRSPYFAWGSSGEYRRMRLEGYKIGLLLFLKLRGTDYGDEIHFTANINGRFQIIDFHVDSALQNGVAILLCGIFAGIYVQILGKPVIKRIVGSRSIRKQFGSK